MLTRLHKWLKHLNQRIQQIMPPWLAAHTPRAGIADSMPRRRERAQPPTASEEGIQVGDDVLLQLIAGGKQHALRTLYDRYCRRVFSLALHITGDRRWAEEVTEDVFVLVWHHHAIGQSRQGTAQDWIAAITRNRALDAVRSQDGTTCQRAVAHTADRLAVRPEHDTFERQTDLRDTLRQVLATLPADQRQALELAYYGGRTVAEIASDEDVPVSTIETRLRLGLMTLRAARGHAQGTNHRERGARDDRASTNDA
ncbi:MAG TPA: sigma-70 family RNA polymerase sigma factor [Herpetosiphonaceae bacterium]